MGNIHPLTLAIRGAGGGGSQTPRTPIESPDSLRSVEYARILDLISEGEIYGFADQDNPLSCVYLNETPVANADGSLNFKNIQIESRVGTQNQDYIRGFEGVESESLVNVELRDDAPWTRAVPNSNVTAVRVRLSTPALTTTNVSNGDVGGGSVGYAIEVKQGAGAFQQVFVSSFTGKASSEYVRSHRIELPASPDGWTIRVTRTTPNADTGAIQDLTFVKSFAEIIDAKFRMPMSALVAVVVDAEQFSNIPARAYRIKGRLIRVPANYDPETRTYATTGPGTFNGGWDGTFQVRYSNNPAWVFYDMAQSKRYGLGHLVPSSLVDKWALYAIGQYCDQEVASGFGYMEPRFTCNAYIASAADALKVMLDLATVFRGIIYANGGSITAVSDKPEIPVYTYTPANVIEGKFAYSGSGRKVRHTVALVSWSDMTDFGRAKIEYVEDTDGIARYGIQETEVIAFGCTSRGQARRLGRYILATERYETDSISFAVGLDGTVAAPGKIIEVADPLRAGMRMGGRIHEATINSVVVDELPGVVNAGDTLVVTLPTAVTQRRTVQSVDVPNKRITVTANFNAVPVAQSVWAVARADLALQTYRIIGVRESDDKLSFEITALQHVPDKFGFVDENLIINEPPTTSMPSRFVPSPTGLVLTPRDVTDQNTSTKVVNLAWTAVSVATMYRVLWRQSQGSWMDLGQITACNVDITGILSGGFEVQVIAYNTLGIASEPAYGGPYDVPPVAAPPLFVGDLIDADDILRTDLDQEVQDRIAAVQAEALARANAILNEQLAREAAIDLEETVRQTADESLAQSISTLAAGTGEQFDSKAVWYFDTDLESWTGNGVPTVSNGFLRPANSSDPWVQSPTGIAVNGASYKYVKLRMKRTGNPVWVGQVTGYNAAGTVIGTLTVPAPSFQADGDATIDWPDIPWTGTVDRIRVKLFAAQTNSDNVQIDWVAVGRPTPGASVAALQEERTARITGDAAEAAARDVLAVQMRGNYTGTDPTLLTQGLVYNERQARISAEGVIVSSVNQLIARQTGAVGGNMLPNPGLLVDTTGWSASHALSISNFPQIGRALVIAPGAGSRYVVSSYADVPAVNNTDYSFGATVRTDGTWYLSIQYFNASGTYLGQTNSANQASTAGGWQRFSVTGNSPANTAFIACVVYSTNSASNFHVARPMFQLGPYSTQYTEERQVFNQATALQSLTATVTTQGGLITSQGQAITALTAEVAGKASASAVTTLTARVSSVEQGGYGVNMLVNSLLLPDATLWTADNPNGWAAPSINVAGADWTPPNMRSYGSSRSGVTSAGQLINLITPRTAVTAGQSYMASSYHANHRANAQLFIAWYNSAGSVIAYTSGPSSGPVNGGNSLAGYNRLYVAATAPTNAVSAAVLMQYSGTGESNPFAWMLRPMLEPLRTGQTLPSLFNTGGTEAFAQYSLRLDVNGLVTGFTFTNDGTTSDLNVVAYNFRLFSPNGGARIEMGASNIRVYDSAGTLRVRMGVW